MPEEEVEYKVEQEPELICPIRMHANIAKGVPIDIECLKEKCAWWHAWDNRNGICAVLFIGDSNLALYEMLDEIRGKL